MAWAGGFHRICIPKKPIKALLTMDCTPTKEANPTLSPFFWWPLGGHYSNGCRRMGVGGN